MNYLSICSHPRTPFRLLEGRALQVLRSVPAGMGAVCSSNGRAARHAVASVRTFRAGALQPPILMDSREPCQATDPGSPDEIEADAIADDKSE